MEIQGGQNFQTFVSKLYQFFPLLAQVQISNFCMQVILSLYLFHRNLKRSKIFKLLYPNVSISYTFNVNS